MNEYKNIEKIKPERLLDLIREFLDQSIDFEYISGINPFLMSFRKEEFYVYIKNVSSAYFSDRDKTTRAQLPVKPEFDEIKKSNIPFIFLGYDGINDVYICWNFHIVKQRLNVGKSVSFYSRTFYQSEVNEGEFIRRTLKNGDIPVFFKRSYIEEFFKNVHSFFNELENILSLLYKDKTDICNNEGKLVEITDHNLLTKLQPYLISNRLLSASQIVGDYYKDKFPNMELKDWINLIKKIKI